MKSKAILFFKICLVEILIYFLIAIFFYYINFLSNRKIVFDNEIFTTIFGVIFYIGIYRFIFGEYILRLIIESLELHKGYKTLLSILITLIFIVVVEYFSNGYLSGFDLDFILHPSFGWNFHLLFSVLITSLIFWKYR